MASLVFGCQSVVLLHCICMYVDSQDEFLLEDDQVDVTGFLLHLQKEREKERARAKEQSEAGNVEKSPAWISMHMSLAEKRFLAHQQSLTQS